jgi:hypothetical protein
MMLDRPDLDPGPAGRRYRVHGVLPGGAEVQGGPRPADLWARHSTPMPARFPTGCRVRESGGQQCTGRVCIRMGTPAPSTKGCELLRRIARLAIARPQRVTAVAALSMVAIGIFGIPVAKSLSSGGSVALSMAVMVLFPIHFLRSFAYGGVATVVFAAFAAVVVTPAVIMLLGDRLDSLDVRRFVRRALRRPELTLPPVEQQFCYRSTKFVMRRAVSIGLAVVAVLLVLGAPFFGVRPGFPDDRVLPSLASAHQVGDQLRTDFPNNTATAVPIVIPGSTGLSDDEFLAEHSLTTDGTGTTDDSGAWVSHPGGPGPGFCSELQLVRWK